MAWGDEEPTEVLERIDPFPFTAEGRRLERMELQLRLEAARLNVDRLEAEKREIEAKLRNARERRNQRLR
jgi:hypothetical protein